MIGSQPIPAVELWHRPEAPERRQVKAIRSMATEPGKTATSALVNSPIEKPPGTKKGQCPMELLEDGEIVTSFSPDFAVESCDII